MNVENLVSMANQIGEFYNTMPERQIALKVLAQHLQKFWEPRMRSALLAHIHSGNPTELSPFVLEAIGLHEGLLG